jgi:polysaccharide biosynthesis/export protein
MRGSYCKSLQSKRNCLFFGLIVTVLTLFASNGCTTGIYRPSTLPDTLVAKPITPANTIDLSRFASKGIDQDTIAWGDLLEVELNAGISDERANPSKVRVAKDGSIIVAPVGQIRVAGLQVEQAEAVVAAECRRRQLFVNPFVSIKIDEQRTNKVTVVGAVKEPGTYELSRSQSSLMASLVEAGGLANDTDLNIEIRHGNQNSGSSQIMQASYSPQNGQPAGPDRSGEVVQVNLATFAPNNSSKYSLEDGDIVTVGKRELPAIQVLGLVKKPGDIELTGEQNIHLLDAIAMAGGCSNPAADKITVLRKNLDNTEPARIAISMKNAIEGDENMILSPGDTIIVRQTPATVTVDIVRTFFHLSFSSATPW